MKDFTARRGAVGCRLAGLLALFTVLAACAGTPQPARFAAPVGAVVPAATPDQTAERSAGSHDRDTVVGRAGQPAASGDEQLAVHFLDVGQGDATLLVASDAVVLVDAGRHDRRDVAGLVAGFGVTAIDVVAITHGHADHIGQLDAVLEHFDVTEVWMSGTAHTTATFRRAEDAIAHAGVGSRQPRGGQATTLGPLHIDVLNPVGLTGDLHADSLALRVTYGTVSFLFTGDAEASTEAEMVARDRHGLGATVYQVGHHGSSTSTTPVFLDEVSPQVAVYSAGTANTYGHPHAEVIQRLDDAGVGVYGTDVHGTITVVTDGIGYRVHTEHAGAVTAEPGAARAPPDGAGAGGSGRCRDRAGEVDLNRAGERDLQRIIHIGPARARDIVALRPFDRVDDLVGVPGIGSVRLQDVKRQGLACV